MVGTGPAGRTVQRRRAGTVSVNPAAEQSVLNRNDLMEGLCIQSVVLMNQWLSEAVMRSSVDDSVKAGQRSKRLDCTG
ncbi:hypothetical protein BaRGS_00022371 [Batillaria attramentaria]|uniref:Uncharacterized protein n=1 Tax=Batillaria attramentaria TaxID=370345 RepID=A0ABD0KHC0_9CAEN